MSISLIRLATWALLCAVVQLHSLQPSPRYGVYSSNTRMAFVSLKSTEELLSAGCAFTPNGHQLTTDHCGMCGGNDSTCEKVQNVLLPGFGQNGYNPAFVIPAYSANVKIVKGSSWPKENWIVINDGDDNIVFDGKTAGNQTSFDYDGAMIKYSGLLPDTTEQLNITGKLLQTLKIEVYTVGHRHLPRLQYSYWTSTLKQQPKNRFEWVTISKWSNCNRLCSGVQKQMIACNRITKTGLWIEVWRADSEQCRHLPLPTVPVRPCNTFCQLQWTVTPIGTCSQPCGPGLQTVQVACFKKLANTQYPVKSANCEHLGAKPSFVSHCQVSQCKTSKWSRFKELFKRSWPVSLTKLVKKRPQY